MTMSSHNLDAAAAFCEVMCSKASYQPVGEDGFEPAETASCEDEESRPVCSECSRFSGKHFFFR